MESEDNKDTNITKEDIVIVEQHISSCTREIFELEEVRRDLRRKLRTLREKFRLQALNNRVTVSGGPVELSVAGSKKVNDLKKKLFS